MRRRDFITLLGGAAAWPLAARAQQRERMRRIGMLMGLAADNPEAQARIGAFLQALQELGWTRGRNIQTDYRWSGRDFDRRGVLASELIALGPDVLVTDNGNLVADLQNVNRSIPIVFAGVIDAVGAGRVESLAHPGGNATGFTTLEFAVSGKWLNLLKEIAPRVTRVAVLGGGGPIQVGQLGALQGTASVLGVELRPFEMSSAEAIERGISAFASDPNGGLIALASQTITNNQDLIISLAAQHSLPAVYAGRSFTNRGGLISYGADIIDGWRGAAGYVDRILRGAKPADLPVQSPTKYKLVINLKTANTLGLDVPPTLLAIADEVIE